MFGVCSERPWCCISVSLYYQIHCYLVADIRHVYVLGDDAQNWFIVYWTKRSVHTQIKTHKWINRRT